MVYPIQENVQVQSKVLNKKIGKAEVESFTNNDIVKIALTGLSVFVAWSLQAALIVTAVNIVLTALIPKATDNQWFKSTDCVKHITSKENQKWYYTLVISTLVFKILWDLKILTKDFLNVSQTVGKLLQAITNPWALLTLVFRICIIAPITEEIFFRGFLQEKIRDVQAFVTNGKHNTSTQKTIRVGLQAIIFGLCHYGEEQGSANKVIVFLTGYLGYIFGKRKEKTKDLWSSMALHFSINARSTATLIFMRG